MILRAWGWAWKQNLPAMEKMVLLVLGDTENAETGACHIRTRRLAEKAGVSQSTAERNLRTQRDKGLITINRTSLEDGSPGSSS